MVAGLSEFETVEKLLTLGVAVGLLWYVAYCAVKTHRRTMALYILVVVGGCTALVLIVGLISGWDGRSLIRMSGFFVIAVVLLRFLWKSDEDLRRRGQ